MEIVFFGNERLATGISSSRSTREALANNGHTVHIVDKDLRNIDKDLHSIQPDIGVLVAYGLIIPKKIIDMFPHGIVNIHPSLLPKGRGSAPIEEVILDGSKHTGVSIMMLAEKMDEGPLLAQQKIELTGNETKQELANSLLNLGSKLLIKCLDDIIAGDITPVPQAKKGVTYTKKIKKSDGIIDWSKSAKQIEREVRAYAGWPKSRTNILNMDCIIHGAEISHIILKAGEISTDKNTLLVGCGKGALSITKIQPAGKKPMSSGEFIRGYLRN